MLKWDGPSGNLSQYYLKYPGTVMQLVQALKLNRAFGQFIISQTFLKHKSIYQILCCMGNSNLFLVARGKFSLLQLIRKDFS